MTAGEKGYNAWYDSRPSSVRALIDKCPPDRMYRFRNSKKQCYIISIEEPAVEGDEATMTVQKIGVGGGLVEMGLGHLDTNQVFGVKADDLEPVVTN